MPNSTPLMQWTESEDGIAPPLGVTILPADEAKHLRRKLKDIGEMIDVLRGSLAR